MIYDKMGELLQGIDKIGIIIAKVEPLKGKYNVRMRRICYECVPCVVALGTPNTSPLCLG